MRAEEEEEEEVAGNYGANPATLRRHEPLLVL